jgi:hypothetical protein
MTVRTAVLIAAIAIMCGGSAVTAQTAEPTYKGDPDVYKLLFEDQNFRVIGITRKKGVHDKAHGHPSPGVIYNITDCKTKLYDPDGKSRESNQKAGTAGPVPVVASHTAENLGDADCQQVIVERK